MTLGPRRHIIDATPQVALITSPTRSVTIPVVVPDRLGQDLRRLHADVAADRPISFDEWLLEQLSTIAYGRGEEPGAALDWLER